MYKRIGIFIFSLPILLFLVTIGYRFYVFDMTEVLEKEIQWLEQEMEEEPLLMAPISANKFMVIENKKELTFLIMKQDTGETLFEMPLPSNNFQDIVIAYQKQGIAFVTKEDTLHAYYLRNDQLQPLALPEYTVSSYLPQQTRVFNQHLYALVKEGQHLGVIVIKDGEVEFQTLKQLTGLTDIIDARFSPHTNTPILEITQYQNERSLALLDVQTQLEVLEFIPNTSNGIALLEAKIHNSPTYVTVHAGEVKLVDTKDMKKMPLKTKLYYPKHISLSSNEVAVYGQLDLYEENTLGIEIYTNDGQLKRSYYPYESASIETLALKEGELYVGSSTSAVLWEGNNNYSEFTKKDRFQTTTEKIAKVQQKIKDSKENNSIWSREKVKSWLANDESIKEITIVFLGFIGVESLIFGSYYFFSYLAKRRIEIAYANGGGKVAATISKIEQTGSFTNELPDVEAVVFFTFKGQQLKKKIKFTTNLINPAKPGDQIDVIYDPVKDKIYKNNTIVQNQLEAE